MLSPPLYLILLFSFPLPFILLAVCIIFWVLTALTSTSISNSNSEQVLLGKKELAKLPILLWFLLLFLSYVSPSLEMPKTCSIPEYGCNMPTIPCTTLGRSWFWMWEKSDAKLIECLLAVTYYITSQIKKLCNASHHHFFQRMFLFYAAFYTDMCRCVCVCVSIWMYPFQQSPFALTVWE